ncbi:hypothetical protein CC2G_015062 [Coprinopsis cinerea AmutBmut pab1-1]|nr:hypothetical protein CC2G_015062 [Coprinopsis cinerea AmutBmut pab1-1]
MIVVSLWQLWFPHTVKIPPCEFRPHFVIHRPNTSHYRDGYIGKKPALCEQQPCPHRYNPLRQQDPDYLQKNLPADALILEASTDNYRTVLYSAHPPPSPSAPPATPPLPLINLYPRNPRKHFTPPNLPLRLPPRLPRVTPYPPTRPKNLTPRKPQ